MRGQAEGAAPGIGAGICISRSGADRQHPRNLVSDRVAESVA